MARWRWLVAFLLVGGQVTAQAQDPALPEYTDQQRWGRLASLNLSGVVSEIELGRSRGMSIDEIGEWLGAYYARTWTGGLDPRSLATSFRWNWLSHPQQTVEMLTFTDTLVVMRGNSPEAAAFGPNQRFRGVTLEELQRVYQLINHAIADQVGVQLETRWEAGNVVLTMRPTYRAIRASDEVRWARAGFIMRVLYLDAIRIAKATGQSPRAAGLASAKVWADTWSATDTPWRLFRGMTWNNMADPNHVCEVLAASPASVRARCNRPWVATVRANAQRSGVSVEDYEAYQLGLEQGIAEARGMTWQVVLEGDDRIITVRRR